jgi:hypothetical protein
MGLGGQKAHPVYTLFISIPSPYSCSVRQGQKARWLFETDVFVQGLIALKILFLFGFAKRRFVICRLIEHPADARAARCDRTAQRVLLWWNSDEVKGRPWWDR